MISLPGGARLLVVLLALPASVRAGEWTVVSSLRLRESYTDNLHLAPPGQAQGEFVAEVSPALALTSQGPRLTFSLDYALQCIRPQREASRHTQQLDAASHFAALPDWLFLDARASISQQSISAFGPQPAVPSLDSSNTTTVRTLMVAPYLQHDFKGLATLLARYSQSSVTSGRLLRVRNSDALLQLTGDNAGHSLNWDLRLSQQNIADARQPDVTMQDAALTLSYPLNRQLSGSATSGYERNNYPALGPQPRGPYATLGLDWEPSPRTRLAASLGHHYYGKTYGLHTSYRQRRMLWTLDYGVDISTTNAQFLSLPGNAAEDFLFQLWETRIPDPATRRQMVRAFIALSTLLGTQGNINYFSHRYYLQKQWQFTSLYSGAASTWSFGLTRTSRTAQSDSAIDSELLIGPTNLALQDRTRQTTLQGGLSWRLNTRSQIALSASSGIAESVSTGRRDRNSAFILSLAHQIQPRLSLSADVRHSRHASNAGGHYRENGVSAALSMQF